ncbi:hypothetical protein RM53_11865 [Brevundimonas nasdae]|uniref:Lipoprotein n=1 Tax=Brevundimonas nasdae TaxID=172043 RepID=A0A0B4DR32_9CAUL|nr:hypothetical protein [Brevundimonas nasdae]KIC56728.1 hypothetical protein RM53_11865 [Brevundimonas nasdae]
MLETIASPRSSIVALAAALLALAACQREPQPAPAPAEKTETPPVVTVAPAPVLDRAGLLEAMDIAASAFAAGREVGGTSLAGRRFVVRQAFGCGAPSDAAEAAADGLATVAWAKDRQSLKFSLAPADWLQSGLVGRDDSGLEAVEGFWLARPWLRTEACPATAPAVSASTQDSPQTVGLAAVFKANGARTGRRNGRAYDFTLRGEDGQPPVPSAQGYRLVLEGRMTAFADGRAIHCRAAAADQRPVCIGAVQLDRVAFEDADGQMLSEWRDG